MQTAVRLLVEVFVADFVDGHVMNWLVIGVVVHVMSWLVVIENGHVKNWLVGLRMGM